MLHVHNSLSEAAYSVGAEVLLLNTLAGAGPSIFSGVAIAVLWMTICWCVTRLAGPPTALRGHAATYGGIGWNAFCGHSPLSVSVAASVALDRPFLFFLSVYATMTTLWLFVKIKEWPQLNNITLHFCLLCKKWMNLQFFNDLWRI